ncbi:MAG: hypothetical protein IPN38_19075 [Flavobacteriales bacterium]|nr:hypothetical protein [Flavobacteriales bacterium]
MPGTTGDIYTHEIVHLFVQKRFDATPHLLNEGVATLLGGMVERDYTWHRANMARYLKEHLISTLLRTSSTYEQEPIDGETSVPYMVGALLCEQNPAFAWQIWTASSTGKWG